MTPKLEAARASLEWKAGYRAGIKVAREWAAGVCEHHKHSCEAARREGHPYDGCAEAMADEIRSSPELSPEAKHGFKSMLGAAQ